MYTVTAPVAHPCLCCVGGSLRRRSLNWNFHGGQGRSYLQRRHTRASGHTHHPYVEAATLYCRHESNTAMVSSLQPYLQCMLSTVSLSVFWLDTVLCGNLSKQARFL